MTDKGKVRHTMYQRTRPMDDGGKVTCTGRCNQCGRCNLGALRKTIEAFVADAGSKQEEISSTVVTGSQIVEDTSRFVPFDFQVSGLAAVPEKGRPRVIWANVIEPVGELAALQERIAAGLEGMGVPSEQRAFVPHVTVARIKFTTASKAIRADVGLLEKEGFGSVHADEVIVFRSELREDGPIHTAVARAPLGPKGG